MKKMLVYVLLASLSGFSFLASASTVTGKITTISIRSTGHIVFNLSVKSAAVCARAGQGGFFINSANPQYKSLYAALIAAQAQDFTVTAVGNNVCTWGTNEDTLWIITRS